MISPDITPEKTAELAISQAEQRFRDVFERAPAGVARVGLDGTWLEVNDRFCVMLGYTFEELTQMRSWELIHPEDLKVVEDEREKLIAGEAQYLSAEIRYLRKDGKVVWIARTGSLVRDASNAPLYFVAVGQDITRIKQDEEKLQHATELFSAATTGSRIMIFRWDLRSGRWEWDRTQPVIAHIPEEVLHTLEGMLTLVEPEDRAELFERLSRSAKEGVGFEHEFRATLPPEGELAWIYGRASVVRDQGGQPAYVTGAFLDMTDYRHLRRELQDHDELLLLAGSAGGVHPWAVDAIVTRRLWWTPSSYHLYGRSAELGPPTRDEFLKLVHPEDQEKIREHLRLLNKTVGDDNFRVEFRTAPISGKVRWILSRGRVHRDPRGWPLRLVGVDIDVTERREAGETLRRAEKMSVLERLAASIAHEVNNPLMALSSQLYLISQSSTLEEAQQYVRMAQEEINRITYYSKRMLRFHRKPSVLIPQRISESVNAVLAMLKRRFPNVRVATDFRDDPLLEIPRDDLEQLFGIVLGNAFEAVAAGGSVKVRVVEWADASGGLGVRVLVGDTGKGMSAEIKSRLFEPFFSTKKLTGLGVGLWIASRIVQDLQGRIKIRSSQSPAHHGTVVSLVLPLRSSLSPDATSAPANAA